MVWFIGIIYITIGIVVFLAAEETLAFRLLMGLFWPFVFVALYITIFKGKDE